MFESLQEEVELIARTVETLQLIDEEEPVGLRKAAAVTEQPEHRVRTSFQILEERELIRSTKDGAVTTERTAEFIAEFDGVVESVRATVEELSTVMSQ
ncbi:hypothetical protein [Haladaptatus sp. DFWS20]|uniref:hypothetical protein n=1 Tax=Haladaptatus sp. DFWS20 TaxID=3403467 RepID=UPI003EBE5D26